MVRSEKIQLLFCLVWLLLFLNCFYWGSQKEGYYIDELWSYGLANSYYAPFLQDQDDYMDHWHGSGFYMNYLTVDSGDAFSYVSVYDNQVHDVHPPLYYMLLHTACSLFKGKFSKWFGLSINLLFFGGVIWLLYRISGLMLGKDSYARLIPPVLYGISGGAIATVVYIRMYMMLIFWGLLFIYLTFLLMEEKKEKTRLFVGLAITSTAGFLTQYYFLIFAFFISVGYLLFRIFHGQWKKVLSFACSVIAGIGTGVLLFPASLSHIFSGEKGQESIGNVFRGGRIFLERFKQYIEITAKGFFFTKKGFGWIGVGILLLGITTFLIGLYEKRLKGENPADYDAKFWILMGTLSGYFILIVQISTDIVDRYQFLVYPVGVLLAVTVTSCFFKQIKKEMGIWGLAIAYLLFCIWYYDGKNINYIYPEYEAVRQRLETEYKDAPGIYVTAGDHLVINNSLFLAQQEMTYPIKEEDLEKLPEICKGKQKDQMILYVDIYFDEYQTAENVAELLGYSSCTLLYDNTFSQIFCLSR